MKKHFTCFILLILCISATFSGPANINPSEAIQPDGSRIGIRVFGDEWYHRTETYDGYTILQNAKQEWMYAVKHFDGSLVPSHVKVSPLGRRKSSEEQFLQKIRKHIEPAEHIIRTLQERNPDRLELFDPNRIKRTANRSAPWNTIVLLIEYPDLRAQESVQSFVDMMNQEGWEGGIGSPGSFRDFYLETSYGKFEISADVKGWYMAKNGYLTYADQNGMDAAQPLVAEAVDAAEAEGVDFSKYDNDGDGEVDGLIIVHSGHGAAQNGDQQYVWPHKWNLSATGNVKNYDGVKIDLYTIQEELQYDRHSGVGMYAHEFGHNMGLPDLYGKGGIGKFCEMASGSWNNYGLTPPHFSAWCKQQMGWADPTVIDKPGTYTFDEVETNDDRIKQINLYNSQTEYFLMENRQKTGWDLHIPGDGILIFHINSANSNNSDFDNRVVDLEEADGLNHLDKETNRGDGGDPFPGDSNNTVFDFNSNPNSRKHNGDDSYVEVTEISTSSSSITAEISVFGGQGEPPRSMINGPYNGQINSEVKFSSAGSNDPDGSIASYAWDFGDGATSGEKNPSHTFSNTNWYEVKLQVLDNVGNPGNAVTIANINNLPTQWQIANMGWDLAKGFAEYKGGILTIVTAGRDIWTETDKFSFVYRKITGDAEVIAEVTDIDAGSLYCKGGVMIRESLDAGSRHAFTLIQNNGDAGFFHRPSTNGQNQAIEVGAKEVPIYLRIVRNGNTFTGYWSSTGSSWKEIGSKQISMDNEVYVGLAASKGSLGDLGTFKFANITGMGAVGIETQQHQISSFNYAVKHIAGQDKTRITWQLPHKDVVTIGIFSINGKLVKNTMHAEKKAGVYSIVINERDFCSGIYYIRVSISKNVFTDKMLVVR